MNRYYIANDKVDLKCYPNYSFEIGDIDGDGRKEFISLDQSGKLLKAFDLEGALLFEKNLDNEGNWGTSIICAADIDNDGCDEIIVPDGERIVAFGAKGRKIRERKLGIGKKDCFGIGIPLLGAAKIQSPDKLSVVAAVAGGEVVALDGDFNEIWKIGGLRHDFGHEIFFADVDGDGLDEICFCTIGNIGQAVEGGENAGELMLLDHDGKVLLRKRVDDYVQDNHFDDTAMADFLGDGTSQILLEKGLLLNLNGEVIWDISDQLVHGQWIAHAPDPNGKGRLIFISELWGNAKKSILFTGAGKKINDIGDMPWPAFDAPEQKDLGAIALPARCHAVRWAPESAPEFFLTQQACTPGPHDCHDTFSFELKALFMDERGELIGELPFGDSQIKGYFYNGEVHSRVADIDGDGQQEIVFPKQDGHIMIIKKRI